MKLAYIPIIATAFVTTASLAEINPETGYLSANGIFEPSYVNNRRGIEQPDMNQLLQQNPSAAGQAAVNSLDLIGFTDSNGIYEPSYVNNRHQAVTPDFNQALSNQPTAAGATSISAKLFHSQTYFDDWYDSSRKNEY